MERSFIFVPVLALAACSRAPSSSPDAGTITVTSVIDPSMPAEPAERAEDAAPPSPCPSGMIYVDTEYCPKIKRECVDMEYEKINHLPICHKFEEGPGKCLAPAEHRQFCIDEYEYPNTEGAHPAWMLTWYEAQATCESKGKRLCWASEWTAACEGPQHTPFPYGYERDHDKCNFDNFFIDPRKAPGVGFVMFSKNKDEQSKELTRLDQSVASGFLKECVSGFGVHDQTGNLDEWVVSDRPPAEKSQFSGLMGGAWGHVRNQCRPMTTSHYSHENYYFWSFRCCADAAGAPSWQLPECKGGDCPIPAPAVEPHDFAPDPVVAAPGEHAPGPSKTKYGAKERKYFENPDGGGGH